MYYHYPRLVVGLGGRLWLTDLRDGGEDTSYGNSGVLDTLFELDRVILLGWDGGRDDDVDDDDDHGSGFS